MTDYREEVARDDPTRTSGGPPESADEVRRWLAVLGAVIAGISGDRLLLVAAGVTFYAILALFPGIGMLVSIYGFFADPQSIAAHLDTLSLFAPEGAVEVLRDELTRLAHQSPEALSLGFAIGFLIALWSANAGVSGLFGALNAVYEEPDRRSLVRFYATTLLFTAGAILLVLLSIAIFVALPVVLGRLPDPGIAALLLRIARWPVLFLIAAAALALVYRWGPCRSAPQWRWIIGCSLLAAFAWLAVSALFSWYVTHFGSYNKTYGSLGAVFGFMTWMWISTVVVLVGGKLDAELERPAERVADRRR